MTRYRILVAAADPRTLKSVGGDLARAGYEVYRAARWREVATRAESAPPDLIVLDQTLAEYGGADWWEKLRGAGHDVMLLLLVSRDDRLEKTAGFRLGVDEYLVGPFSPDGLVLRVKAVLARRLVIESMASQLARESIVLPDLHIDPLGRVVHVRKKKVELTNKEFDLLWALASKPNRVVSRLQLLNHVWHSAFPGDENTVTVHIHRLRGKLERDPAHPMYIKTARGRGYKFEVPLAV